MDGARTPIDGNVLQDLIRARMSRRQALRMGFAGAAAASVAKLGFPIGAAGAATPGDVPLPALDGLTPVPDVFDAFSTAPGLRSDVLIRWGDPVVAGAPAFAPNAQTAAAQALQFGYNCDYTAILPAGDRWLLFVSHEYTSPADMFPGYPDPVPASAGVLQPFVDIELEAHGASVVALERDGARFVPVADPRNRRVTANTPMRFSGPAAGALGPSVTGMLNNCAGGLTPWGTVLTCEENFNQYFANAGLLAPGVDKDDFALYGLPNGESERKWERVYPNRFDVSVAPAEPYKFGWVVEIDPSDPDFVPVKHTALGRTKHEAANTVVAPDGRVVVYSGDDERFQYAYKFVTAQAYDPDDRAANLTLLDEGTLYVARLDADGSGRWLPLTYAGNEVFWNLAGFASQADLCLHTRRAAAQLGATKMDRPEDIEVNPVGGHVFMALTNNTNRAVAANPGRDAANPRAANKHGHIIELAEDGDDHTSLTFQWDVFMLCGHGEVAANLVADPSLATTAEQTYFGGWTGPSTLVSCPDNLAFDRAGNLIVGTDGMPGTVDANDGVFVVPTTGTYRGRLVQLAAVPAGAESTGPFLSDDDETLLVAVQHPGEGNIVAGAGSPELNTVSRWPDSSASGAPAIPRPSVVQVTRIAGGKVVPTATAKLVPLAPQRVLDTRTGVGTTGGKVPADGTVQLAFELTPAELSALASVVLTTTLVDATAPGFATVVPSGGARPTVSALNVDAAGQTRANLVTTSVGRDAAVSIYVQSGGHVLADLNAIYLYASGSRDGRLVPVEPTRLFDTRVAPGGRTGTKLGGGQALAVAVAGRAGVPARGAGAVVLNVTATEAEAAGYVTVFPEGVEPGSSNLNYGGPGQDVANQVIVPLGRDGSIRVLTYATAHVLADVVGWITDDSAEASDSGLYVPVPAMRVRDTRTGVGGSTGALAAEGTTTVPVASQGAVPAGGVAAVAANLTVTESAGAGYLTAWSGEGSRPLASALNTYAEGQTVAAHLTIPVAADGTISVYTSAGGHVLVDVTGWYTA